MGDFIRFQVQEFLNAKRIDFLTIVINTSCPNIMNTVEGYHEWIVQGYHECNQ